MKNSLNDPRLHYTAVQISHAIALTGCSGALLLFLITALGTAHLRSFRRKLRREAQALAAPELKVSTMHRHRPARTSAIKSLNALNQRVDDRAAWLIWMEQDRIHSNSRMTRLALMLTILGLAGLIARILLTWGTAV